MKQKHNLNERTFFVMNILFVCTGNTCRSPMAAEIFKKIIDEKNLKNINISSAGIAADNNSRASQNAMEACKELNIDLNGHISKSIFDVNLKNIDKFIVMTQTHKDFLIGLGVKDEKILVLGNQISDPFGGNIETYKNCRDQIYKALCKLIDDMFLDKNYNEQN